MSDADVDANAILIAEDRARIYLASVFTQTVLNGVMLATQLLMCSYCLYVYQKSSQELRRKRRLYIAVSWAIFVTDGFYRLCSLKYFSVILTARQPLIDVLELRAELYGTWYVNASIWAAVICGWLGDGLLVYRCCIVWTDQRLVTFLLVPIYLAFVGLSFGSQLNQALTGNWLTSLETAWVSFSVITHCLVTILIAFKLLRLRKRQTEILKNFDSGIYLGAIAVVAESAGAYAIIVIFGLIVSQHVEGGDVYSRGWPIAWTVAQLLFDLVYVLAPQVIVWRVTLGHSFAHSTRKTTLLSTLAFHRRPTDTLSQSDEEKSLDHEGSGDVVTDIPALEKNNCQ